VGLAFGCSVGGPEPVLLPLVAGLYILFNRCAISDWLIELGGGIDADAFVPAEAATEVDASGRCVDVAAAPETCSASDSPDDESSPPSKSDSILFPAILSLVCVYGRSSVAS
jgi:hypothetical protein